MGIIKLVSGKPSGNSNKRASNGKNTAPSARAPKAPQQKNKKVKAPTPYAGNSGGRKAIVITAAVLAALCAAFEGLGAYANGLDTIYPNVTMEGVSLSGMTVSQAADTLVSSNIGTDTDKTLTVDLPAGCELTVSAKDAGAYLGAPDAAVYAYDRCHGNGFLGNTLSYIKCLASGMALTVASGAEINEDYLRAKTDEAAKQVSLALMNSSVQIGETSISVLKGASAVTIDTDKLYDTVKKALLEGRFEPFKFNAESNGGKSEEIDLQNLYDTVYREPENAE